MSRLLFIAFMLPAALILPGTNDAYAQFAPEAPDLRNLREKELRAAANCKSDNAELAETAAEYLGLLARLFQEMDKASDLSRVKSELSLCAGVDGGLISLPGPGAKGALKELEDSYEAMVNHEHQNRASITDRTKMPDVLNQTRPSITDRNDYGPNSAITIQKGAVSK